VGTELIDADGQTDMTKQIVAFSIFANAPKNGKIGSKMEATEIQLPGIN
jgi:hypothetical protein